MNETIPKVLADCLDAIDRGEVTPEECLAKYPQYRQELAAYLQIATRIRSAPPVPIRMEFRRNTRARLLAQLTDRHPVTFGDRLRHIWQIVIHSFRRRSAVTFSLIIAVLISLLGSGVVSASDGARPGDVLYDIDQTIEAMRLSLADPTEAAYLQLDFASERLQEAEQLSMEGDQANVKIALQHYNEMILNVAKTIGQIEDDEQAALGDLLDQTLSVHEEQLARITSNIGKGEQGVVETEPVEFPDDASGKADANYCDGADRHPHAEDLAEDYEDDFAEDEDGYGLIMDWFCEGNFGFGEIEHALWTSSEVDAIFPPDDETNGKTTDFVEKVELLLAMRAAKMGWGEIWQLLGVIRDDVDVTPEEYQEYCVGANPHPVAKGLAEDYEGVEYDDIMTWFCDDEYKFGFGEIMHALETSEITLGDIDIPDYSPEELLGMREELGGWGKVWQKLGLIGKPEDAGKPEDPGNKPDSPPGKPEDAGKPDDVGPNSDTNKPVKTDKPKDKQDKTDKPKD